MPSIVLEELSSWFERSTRLLATESWMLKAAFLLASATRWHSSGSSVTYVGSVSKPKAQLVMIVIRFSSCSQAARVAARVEEMLEFRALRQMCSASSDMEMRLVASVVASLRLPWLPESTCGENDTDLLDLVLLPVENDRFPQVRIVREKMKEVF